MRSPNSGGTLNPLRICVQKVPKTGRPNPALVRGVTVMLYFLDCCRPVIFEKVFLVMSVLVASVASTCPRR